MEPLSVGTQLRIGGVTTLVGLVLACAVDIPLFTNVMVCLHVGLALCSIADGSAELFFARRRPTRRAFVIAVPAHKDAPATVLHAPPA